MATLWDAFLEDYANEIFNWSLRYTLEIFWYYCQDGNKAVAKFLRPAYKEMLLKNRKEGKSLRKKQPVVTKKPVKKKK